MVGGITTDLGGGVGVSNLVGVVVDLNSNEEGVVVGVYEGLGLEEVFPEPILQ